MEDETQGSRVVLNAPRGKRVDYKAKYFTMRGYAVILAVSLAAVVFGVVTSRIFFK